MHQAHLVARPERIDEQGAVKVMNFPDADECRGQKALPGQNGIVLFQLLISPEDDVAASTFFSLAAVTNSKPIEFRKNDCRRMFCQCDRG